MGDLKPESPKGFRICQLQNMPAGECWGLAQSPREGEGNEFNLAGRDSMEPK